MGLLTKHIRKPKLADVYNEWVSKCAHCMEHSKLSNDPKLGKGGLDPPVGPLSGCENSNSETDSLSRVASDSADSEKVISFFFFFNFSFGLL